jgi:hypothetical protein
LSIDIPTKDWAQVFKIDGGDVRDVALQLTSRYLEDGLPFLQTVASRLTLANLEKELRRLEVLSKNETEDVRHSRLAMYADLERVFADIMPGLNLVRSGRTPEDPARLLLGLGKIAYSLVRVQQEAARLEAFMEAAQT